MKRLTAVAALLCACSPTHAAEWVRMSTIDINQHWYDRSKIFVDGDLVSYWRRVTFRSPQRSKAGMASSAMYRERVDCRTHMHTTLGYLLYSKDQSVLDNVNTPEAAPEPIVETNCSIVGESDRRAPWTKRIPATSVVLRN